MNTLIRALSLVALFAAPAAASCLNMESPAPGTARPVGPLLTLSDGNVSLRPFLNASGWTASGRGTFVASNHANGSPVQELNLNNINLSVVPAPEVKRAKFVYADFGGNVNLIVNGVLANVADLSMAPAVVGGVNVTVSRINMFGFHFGQVTLNAATAPIHAFTVGGQEFFVDDVCW